MKKFLLAHLPALIGLSVVFGLFGLRFALGLPCPIRYLTGISCPGCGMTRGLWELVRLNFSAAWYFHPAAYVLPPACALWVLFRLKGWKRASWVPLILLAVCMVAVYLWRLAAGDHTVVTCDPREGLIGRGLLRLLGLR